MTRSWVLWLVAWLSVAVAATTDSISEALAGSSARLTCGISPELSGDSVVQVTWYRQDSADDSPIYTYDARGQTGNRWSDHALGERIYMRAVGGEAQLTIDPVDAADEAQYRCSVEFRRSVTRTAFVNLTVVGESIMLVKTIFLKWWQRPSYILKQYMATDSLLCEYNPSKPGLRPSDIAAHFNIPKSRDLELLTRKKIS